MKKLCIATTVPCVIAAFTFPTFGQTLTERIAAIKKERAEEQQAAQLPKELSPKAKLLQALVYNRLTVSFDQTPVHVVFDYFRTTLASTLLRDTATTPSATGSTPKRRSRSRLRIRTPSSCWNSS